MIVFLDLETRSRCDIKQCGGNVYVQDESTELLCGAAMIVQGDRAEMHLWGPNPAISEVRQGSWRVKDDYVRKLGFDPSHIRWADPKQTTGGLSTWLQSCAAAGATFVAHNAEGFDRPALERWGLPTEGPAGPVKWVDTAHRARQSGLPAGLDEIGRVLFGLGKDTKGKKVLELSYKPHKKTGEFVEPDGARMGLIARYCARDVLLMAAAWYDEGWGEEHPDDDVRRLHCEIDRRGVPADLALADRLYRESLLQKDAWLLKAAKFGLDETTLRSSVALPKWLSNHGYAVENAQKGTLQRVLASIEDTHGHYEAITTAIEARLAFNRVTEGKALAALRKTCPDGRMRGVLVYWGAHTGRWSGRGLQPQNLPAPVKGFTQDAYDVDTPAAVAAIEQATKKGVSEEAVLASMIRGILTAERGRVLLMIDYSQIEARVLLWLAGDKGGLQTFLEDKDIYMATAAGMFGMTYEAISALGKKSLQRTVGKIATLALGYQGGPGALTAFAEGYNFSFAENGLDPTDVVNRWRDANYLIAGTRKGIWRTPEGNVVVTRRGGLWREYQRAAIETVRGLGDQEVGRCRFTMKGPHLHIVLPSGRPLVYRNATHEPWENNYGSTTKTLVFDSVRFGKVVREATYGGRLCENITQAVARDVMAYAMLRLAEEDFRTLFTVHDEIILSARSEDRLSRAEEIMTQNPPWAEGLPLAAEGETGFRYRK